MTEDPQDRDYLDLFKPKGEVPLEGSSQTSNAGASSAAASAEPADVEPAVVDTESWESTAIPVEPMAEANDGIDSRVKVIGVAAGGGCLLVMLLAVVIFAFYQVFLRQGGEEENATTPTRTAEVAVATREPPPPTVESPITIPIVSSTDVRVPLNYPERLAVGDTLLSVQPVKAPPGSWPPAPATVDTVNWVYGTVVNYIMGLSPAQRNLDLVTRLAPGDTLSLYTSTGVILHFTVSEVTVGGAEDPALFDQISPRLTLAVLTDDPTQRVAVSAAYRDDESQDIELFTSAAIGLIGTPVVQGPVRVTVLDVYQATAEETGLPYSMGYLLMDVQVENIGDETLDPNLFWTFVMDAANKRYPVTVMAEQYANYGSPVDPLAPGETVIGSIGFLVPENPEGEVRWVFNPQPGSKFWVVVPLSYDLPAPPATAEPAPKPGFVVVTIETDDIFVNREDNLLDIVLRVQNTSTGVVVINREDVSLSTWTEGEISLVAPAPQLPWQIEPGELRLFQLQYRLPTEDTALLSVKGYTFSIENLGGE
jgi:hypothetical protein